MFAWKAECIGAWMRRRKENVYESFSPWRCCGLMFPPVRVSGVARIGEKIYTIGPHPLDVIDHAPAGKEHLLVGHDSDKRKNSWTKHDRLFSRFTRDDLPLWDAICTCPEWSAVSVIGCCRQAIVWYEADFFHLQYRVQAISTLYQGRSISLTILLVLLLRISDLVVCCIQSILVDVHDSSR